MKKKTIVILQKAFRLLNEYALHNVFVFIKRRKREEKLHFESKSHRAINDLVQTFKNEELFFFFLVCCIVFNCS